MTLWHLTESQNDTGGEFSFWNILLVSEVDGE